MRALALRSALTDRAREGRVAVIDRFSFDTPKTKDAVKVLEALGVSGKALVVLDTEDLVAGKSFRNLTSRPCDHRRPDQHARHHRARLGGVHEGGDRERERAQAPKEGRRRDIRAGGGRRVKDSRDVILAPVVSEKSYSAIDRNVYTFLVAPTANKTEIEIAVEKIFDVKVCQVNTMWRHGKQKRTRYTMGQRSAQKRALVTLAEGDKIEIFQPR